MADLRVPEKRFRPELEGIRAVAALLVAVYHIWIGSVSGGVDVFFIVSGYLITTSLLSRMVREGRINYLENLLGLAKRLFPLAFTVLAVSAALSIALLPLSSWRQTIAELFASMFYFQNWQLANSAVDYLAQNNTASPFQHFWALSIQGQFYVTWPIVITLVYLLATKILKTPVRKTLLAVLSVIFLASLSYSVYITAVNQPWAYFDTFARAWEFSLGGMLALLLPYLKFPNFVHLIIGWAGLAIIAFTGMVLPVSTVFPGFAALLPTGGVILVIIASENGQALGVQKLLGSKPFQYFGSISYGFYLWHWPLLVFYYAYFNTETVTTLGGIGILAVTVVLSIMTIRLVEKPVREMPVKHSKKRLSKVLVALMAPAILVGLSWGVFVQANSGGTATIKDNPGAQAVSENIQPSEEAELQPDFLSAKEDLPTFYEDINCYSTDTMGANVKECSFGVTEDPEHVLALVGGSHSGHWFPALEAIAEDLNMRIDVYNKNACRFSSDDFDGELDQLCMEWNENLEKKLIEDPPDLIFTTANIDSEDAVPSGYIEKWKQFEDVAEIFAVRDNPRMENDPTFCLDSANLKDCSVQRDKALADEVPWENTEGIPDNVTFADMSEYFCTDDACPPVVGNVLVYRDKHHLTTLYSQTMGPALKEYLEPALENLN
ncbi:acyltransferase [Planococcus sp. CP5-4]|uniref:acyltransferase family protein n=1 Tax=unclassified Planococcus (in: firmicutes) TaxID=2662419 RepID=UPI001C211469|nr:MULTISPECIES: acyltransferase family protein [unclassified Planococcus (in: firmicutes)]MBU9674060.1 acyltransferase [Planococcus sp. CP5-4_YE]MBV0909931.1 acyltransferase [Planococcus sp. CP5-4_UN]MBW6064811.1 acyltransferase [Planococcus sp. CP5-4]